MVYVYFAVAFYVVVYSLSLVMALLVRVSDAFRSRRRGGASSQPVLNVLSLVDQRTTGQTPSNVVYFSSPTGRGGVWAGTETRPTRRAQSRSTARGSCGSAAGVGDSPGQRQANIARNTA